MTECRWFSGQRIDRKITGTPFRIFVMQRILAATNEFIVKVNLQNKI